MHMLHASKDVNALTAYNMCNGVVRALIAHHRLACMLYDRDLRAEHVDILRSRQVDFDNEFVQNVIEETSRVKAHMYLCEHGFPRQLLLYGSLSHCDAKMLEMGHQLVTDRIRRRMTNDKEIVPTLLTSIEVAHSYECLRSKSGSIELASTASERAFDSRVDDELRQSKEGYAHLYSVRWLRLLADDKTVFEAALRQLNVPVASVQDANVCHDLYIFRELTVMGYQITVPQEQLGRDVVCFRYVYKRKHTRQFGRVFCMLAGSDRQVFFALRMFHRVRPKNVADFPFYLCEERQNTPVIVVRIDDIVCPVSLLTAPEQMTVQGVSTFMVVSRHDLPEVSIN
jgi:hypothetical protein